ncbi:MAG: O-antigen ligase family protein [Thermoleophilia bacterium]
MTIQARQPVGPAPIPRRTLLWAMLAAAVGAALTVLSPPAGFAFAVLVAVGAMVRGMPIGTAGVRLTALTAVAAVAGPNLAIPQAPSLFAFRVLIAVLLFGALAYTLAGGRLGGFGPISIPVALLGLITLWAAMSIAWADDKGPAARWTLLFLLEAALAVSLPLAFATRRRAIRLLVVLGAVFAVSSILALMEIKLGIRLPTSRLAKKSATTTFAATSLFGNENNLATYLTLTLPYLLVLPLVFHEFRLRVLGLAASAAALVALLFTGSKANLLATGIILVTLLLFFGTDPRQRRRALGAVLVAAAAIGLVVPAVLGGGLIKLPQRAITKFDFGILQSQVSTGTGSGAVRDSLLKDGLALVGDTGGIGVGAGNADTHVRALQNFPGVSNMHDWWLEVVVNLGLVGLALYVCFYLFLFTRQLRIARTAQDPLLRYLGLAGAASLAGFVMGSLGPSSVLTFAPMWLTFGLGMLTVTLARRAPDRDGRVP